MNEIHWTHDLNTVVLYATIQNSQGEYWNGLMFVEEEPLSDGVVYLVESPAGSYYYVADFPTAIDMADDYLVTIYEQEGESPAFSDNPVAHDLVCWDGSAEYDERFLASKLDSVKLAPDGLDNISATSPSGVATTFREMIVQLWSRFFGRVTLTRTAQGQGQIQTYNSDDELVTTQITTDDGSSQTQGAAE